MSPEKVAQIRRDLNELLDSARKLAEGNTPLAYAVILITDEHDMVLAAGSEDVLQVSLDMLQTRFDERRQYREMDEVKTAALAPRH